MAPSSRAFTAEVSQRVDSACTVWRDARCRAASPAGTPPRRKSDKTKIAIRRTGIGERCVGLKLGCHDASQRQWVIFGSKADVHGRTVPFFASFVVSRQRAGASVQIYDPCVQNFSFVSSSTR